MIQDNQKNFSRLQMLIDAIVIAVTYVLAWMIRFIGPFAYSAVRALAFEEYMFALIFIIPGYLLLYQAFTLYEPLHMQGRRLVLANIIKANVLGLLLIVFSLYMMGESDFSRLTVYIFCVINIFVPGENIKITVGPKGFGSENMSAIRMFKPSAGIEGIKDFILETVETAGPNPCPPMVVGVGIGGTFDKAALLAKKALMRPVDSENEDPYYADLEKEMLEKINQLGIGPQGFGGKTTAIGLNIETMPTHIAGMPCAINISCHVTRHKTEVI